MKKAKTLVEVMQLAQMYVAAGWCKYSLSDPDGNVCALGAIHEAVTGSPTWPQGAGWFDSGPAAPYVEAVADLIPGWTLPRWNNRDETTQTDVLNLFSKVIARAEAEGK